MPISEENHDPSSRNQSKPVDKAGDDNDGVERCEVVDAEVVDAEVFDTEVVGNNALESEDVEADAEIVGDDGSLGTAEAIGAGSPGADAVNGAESVAESAFDLSVQRLSAKGGAVGSVLLSLFGLAGLMISPYSVVNVLMAILFGLWGLQSPLRLIAKLGLGLAALGLGAFVFSLQ